MSKLIHTWRDLLLPNEWLPALPDRTGRLRAVKTSTFVPPMFSFDLFPSRVHPVEDLPFKMQDDLRHIQVLDQRFAAQASRTNVKSNSGFGFTPEGVVLYIIFSSFQEKGRF